MMAASSADIYRGHGASSVDAPVLAVLTPCSASSDASSGGLTPARIMAYKMKRPCSICIWRNAVLPRDGTEESPTKEIHTPVQEMQHTGHPEYFIRMQIAMHERLPDLWMDIAVTQKLHAGSPRRNMHGTRWFRCPTRNMRPLSPVPSSHLQTVTESITDYYGTMIYPQPTALILCFIWCQLYISSQRTRGHQDHQESWQTRA